MLVHVRCERCQLPSVWTDDPEGFLSTVCLHSGRCLAKFRADGSIAPSATSDDAATPGRRAADAPVPR
jgi:hypothetical protein